MATVDLKKTLQVIYFLYQLWPCKVLLSTVWPSANTVYETWDTFKKRTTSKMDA